MIDNQIAFEMLGCAYKNVPFEELPNKESVDKNSYEHVRKYINKPIG